jgi:thioesterase domain-containing protein
VNSSQLEHYLHEHIPLSAHMQVTVLEATVDSIILSAPLAPNINHRDTVFGGSEAAIAILAAWSLLHTKLTGAGIATRLVIQRNSMSYDRAIIGDFTAHAESPSLEAWSSFASTLRRKGRARISVAANLTFAGAQAARFQGEFVALGYETISTDHS